MTTDINNYSKSKDSTEEATCFHIDFTSVRISAGSWEKGEGRRCCPKFW